MFAKSLVSLFAIANAAAVPAKRQEGPLVYSQGSNDQSGAVQGSSTYNTQSLGCWQDNYPQTRTLNGSFFNEPTYTTPETCAKYCANLGYLYSGTECTPSLILTLCDTSLDRLTWIRLHPVFLRQWSGWISGD